MWGLKVWRLTPLPAPLPPPHWAERGVPHAFLDGIRNQTVGCLFDFPCALASSLARSKTSFNATSYHGEGEIVSMGSLSGRSSRACACVRQPVIGRWEHACFLVRSRAAAAYIVAYFHINCAVLQLVSTIGAVSAMPGLIYLVLSPL